MLYSVRWALAAVALVGILCPAAGANDQAQDKRRLAITDLAEVDQDFAFQGEYLGSACWPGEGQRLVGLQVVALGDGKFDAVYYRGGLPGAGWDRATQQKLTGQLEDGLVTLRNATHGIAVVPRWATVGDARGQRLGQLRKIKRVSPSQHAPPPPGAVVLFDGSQPQHLEKAQLTEQGLLLAGATTAMPVGDFQLHVEFRTPYMPYARGQGRGNSGVYIQRRYEVQILDSFGLDGGANECGGLYRQREPEVNMCLPPLAWQTFDIYFTAPRWDDEGNKRANARVTVLHNGEPIHRNREITAKTGAGQPEGPEMLPIYFQHHGNPVQFRNLWIVLRDQADPHQTLAEQPATLPDYGSTAVRRPWLLGRMRRLGR